MCRRDTGRTNNFLVIIRLKDFRSYPASPCNVQFVLGERAKGYRDALVEGAAAAEDFVIHTPPDVVVEVEITHADEGRIGRYADLGVRELWRLHGRKGTWDLRVDFLALPFGSPPCPLAASEVLPGLTPDDVCEAAEGVRAGLTTAERMEAVARIVRRRQRASVRVREEEPPPYGPGSNVGTKAAAPVDQTA